jgi:hypothetical protein
MQKSNIKMENDRSKFKNLFSHKDTKAQSFLLFFTKT